MIVFCFYLFSGQEKAITKSKYEEDIYINNHSAVYGSYWESGQWGFACCHSFVKMSYCTGEQGKIAARVCCNYYPYNTLCAVRARDDCAGGEVGASTAAATAAVLV